VSYAKFERYDAYKYSDFEWLGEVPNHWKIRRLKDISKLIIDGTHFTPDYTDYGVHFLSVTDITRKPFDIQKSKFISHDAHRDLIKRCYPKKGDILLSKNGTIGVPFVIDFNNEVSIYVSLCLIKLPTTTNSRYSYYSFLALFMFEQYNLHSKMTSVTNLHLDKLKNFYQLSPSLPEQNTIAAYLDTKTTQIDRKIDLLTQKATQYGKLKQSLINETVTRGLDKSVAMKDGGVEWIGEVPEHWEVKRIKDLSRLRSGDSIVSEQIEKEGKYPVYGGNGLRGYYSKYTNNGEYILIGRQGALCGNINYASGKFWASEHAVVTYLRQSIDIKWYGEILRIMNLNQYSLAAAQPGLAMDRIRRLLLPVPPLPEQKAIADYLDTKTAHIDCIVETINTQIEKLKELRKTLINDVVTGKIKVPQ
jgi:type I restriction enzyme S subunit